MKNKIQQIILSIVILSCSISVMAANECRLKYKNNGSAFQYKYSNKGQNINFTRSNFTDAFNVGRNDMRLTLEYFDVLAQRNKTEYLYLVKIGNNTLPIPPIPLIGKKLKKIECKNYATQIDTQAYLQQFGSSASQLVSNASSQAVSAITSAATSATNTFKAQVANGHKNVSQAALNEINNALDQAKEDANTFQSNIRPRLAQDFPEVNTAINATNSYSWSLSSAVMNQGEQNIQKLLTEVNRMDQKYQVSQTASKLVKVNLRKDFPEIHQLGNRQCSVNYSGIDRLKSDITSLVNQINQLERKYKLKQTAGRLTEKLISLPSIDIQHISRFTKFKKCNDNWSSLVGAFKKDWKLVDSYSAQLNNELKKLNAKKFTTSQKRFFTEAQKLIKATQDLDREHKAQERKETTLAAAKAAHLSALKKIDNDIGPMGDFLEKLPGGSFVITVGVKMKNMLPKWMTRDPERLKANIADAKRKGVAYEKALIAYDKSYDLIQKKYDTWLKQISVTSKTATQVKIKLPKTSSLLKLLTRPPKLKSIGNAFNTSVACTQEFLKLSSAALGVFEKTMQQYITNIDKILKTILPEDVRADLFELSKSVDQLVSLGMGRLNTSELKNSATQMNSTKVELKRLVTGDPTKANFAQLANQLITTLKQHVSAVKQDANGFVSSLGQFNSPVQLGLQRANKLAQTLSKHATSSFGDVKTMVKGAKSLLENQWGAIDSGFDSTVSCLDASWNDISAVERSFPSRLRAFIKAKATVAANGLPQSIKTELRAIATELNSMATTYQQFSTAVGAAKTALVQLNQSRDQAIASLIPTLKSNAGQKFQQLLPKASSLKQKVGDVSTKFQQLAGKQNQMSNRLVSLGNELNKQGKAVRKDARKLVFTAFDSSMLGQQLNATNGLFSQWNSAIQTLPTRIASIATGGVSDQVITQVQQGINTMNSKFNSLNRCITTANTKRTAITSSQRRTTVLNQTLANLNTQATATITSLNRLLPPTANILSQLNNVMTNAAQLANRLGAIEQTARSNFMSNANSLINDLNGAKTCVINNKSQILSKKTQLLQLLSN